MSMITWVMLGIYAVGLGGGSAFLIGYSLKH